MLCSFSMIMPEHFTHSFNRHPIWQRDVVANVCLGQMKKVSFLEIRHKSAIPDVRQFISFVSSKLAVILSLLETSGWLLFTFPGGNIAVGKQWYNYCEYSVLERFILSISHRSIPKMDIVFESFLTSA